MLFRSPMMRALRELPCCVGWHVCGAYLRNRCRGHGFRDERNQTIEPLVSAAAAANRETLEWMRRSREHAGGLERLMP